MHHHLFLRIRTSAVVILIFTFLLPLFPGYGLAQTEEEFLDEFAEEDFGSAIQQVPVPANTVSCFDYYRFGSVQANLTAPVVGTVSGAPITFSGTITNDNPYPIVDGALYVKIFRDRGSTNDGNGPDVVDQFLAKSDIVIPANSAVPVSFSWQVPAHAKTGEYKLATFFATSRKFNLLGLSFTDDVVGNTVGFSVSGEQSTGVSFDKAGVTVAGTPYYFAAFPPRTSANEPVEVRATVRNTTGTSETARILWTVYQWDAQLRENVVQEESASVNVPAGGSAPVSITITDSKYPVYLAVGTLIWKDTKSIIGVRFVREGVDRTRINFPGLLSFPIVAGQQNEVFSCLHNSGSAPLVPGGRLELTLTDENGGLIHEYVYEGDVTGAMMGVAEAFTASRSYDRVVLDARLYEGDAFIDEAHLVFDCESINPALCMAEDANTSSLSSRYLEAGLALAMLLLLLILVYVYRRLTRTPEATIEAVQ